MISQTHVNNCSEEAYRNDPICNLLNTIDLVFDTDQIKIDKNFSSIWSYIWDVYNDPQCGKNLPSSLAINSFIRKHHNLVHSITSETPLDWPSVLLYCLFIAKDINKAFPIFKPYLFPAVKINFDQLLDHEIRVSINDNINRKFVLLIFIALLNEAQWSRYFRVDSLEQICKRFNFEERYWKAFLTSSNQDAHCNLMVELMTEIHRLNYQKKLIIMKNEYSSKVETKCKFNEDFPDLYEKEYNSINKAAKFQYKNQDFFKQHDFKECYQEYCDLIGKDKVDNATREIFRNSFFKKSFKNFLQAQNIETSDASNENLGYSDGNQSSPEANPILENQPEQLDFESKFCNLDAHQFSANNQKNVLIKGKLTKAEIFSKNLFASIIIAIKYRNSFFCKKSRPTKSIQKIAEIADVNVDLLMKAIYWIVVKKKP